MRKTIDGGEFLDVTASSRELRLSEHYVRLLIRFGSLPAIRLNGRYWIPATAVAAEKARRRTPVAVVPKAKPPRKKGAATP